MNILPNNYIETFKDLKNRIRSAQYKSISAANSEMIPAYLDIGKTISEKTKQGWGQSVIEKLSRDLQSEFIGMKGLSDRNLYRMKIIYERLIENQISPQLVAKIPWGHSDLIFNKIKERHEQIFYFEKTAIEGWSRDILKEKIKFDTYKKTLAFQNNFDKTIDSNEIGNYRLNFIDEYNLSFLNLEDRHTERK